MNDANITLYHEDGRVRKVGSSWKYDYYIKDHLGNIRVVFEDIDGNEIITPEEIKGRYDYYSFGMQHAGNGLGYLGSDQKEVYSYNGKELVEEMNANLLLYGARQMDGALGRWFGIDALAEEYPSTSPYVYAMNNPIFLIDPDGMRVDSSYLVNTETNVVTPIDDRGGNAVDYIYFWNGKPLAEEGGRMDLLVKNVEPVYTNEVYSPSQSRLPGYIIYNNRMPPSGASSTFDDPITGGISKATFGTLGLLYALMRNAPKAGSQMFKVGAYNTLKGIETGLDAHHVGQRALMKKLIPGYNANTAPAILVPKQGHTLGSGVLSRGTTDFLNARQVLARDIFELRRVYPNIPNSSLQQLIELNKSMYPGSFIK